jgi:hypothetical protein
MTVGVLETYLWRALLTVTIPLIFWYQKKQDIGGKIKHSSVFVKLLCFTTIYYFWLGIMLAFSSIRNILDGSYDELWLVIFFILSPIPTFILISNFSFLFAQRSTGILDPFKPYEKDVWSAMKRTFLLFWLFLIILPVGGFLIVGSLGYILWHGIGDLDYWFVATAGGAPVVFWIGLKPVNDRGKLVVSRKERGTSNYEPLHTGAREYRGPDYGEEHSGRQVGGEYRGPDYGRD